MPEGPSLFKSTATGSCAAIRIMISSKLLRSVIYLCMTAKPQALSPRADAGLEHAWGLSPVRDGRAFAERNHLLPPSGHDGMLQHLRQCAWRRHGGADAPLLPVASQAVGSCEALLEERQERWCVPAAAFWRCMLSTCSNIKPHSAGSISIDCDTTSETGLGSRHTLAGSNLVHAPPG